jgi:uncharacterized protein
MTLQDRLTHDIADAMRARDATRLSALRMAKAALMNAGVAKGRDLDDADAQQVLASLLKQRRDSIDQFRAAGRTDLVDKETAELAVLEPYAPPAVPADELDRIVSESIAATRAASAKDIGRVMKTVMAALAGRTVDGKTVSDLVRKKLSG